MAIDQPPGDPSREERASASSYEEIALSAYFIALERARRGEEGDPLKDWIEAEQQLAIQTGTTTD